MPNHKPNYNEPTPGTFIRFEDGSQDRISPDYGPFEWVQFVYGQIHVSIKSIIDNGQIELAGMLQPDKRLDSESGPWELCDGTRWTDIIIHTDTYRAGGNVKIPAKMDIPASLTGVVTIL